MSVSTAAYRLMGSLWRQGASTSVHRDRWEVGGRVLGTHAALARGQDARAPLQRAAATPLAAGSITGGGRAGGSCSGAGRAGAQAEGAGWPAMSAAAAIQSISGAGAGAMPNRSRPQAANWRLRRSAYCALPSASTCPTMRVICGAAAEQGEGAPSRRGAAQEGVLAGPSRRGAAQIGGVLAGPRRWEQARLGGPAGRAGGRPWSTGSPCVARAGTRSEPASGSWVPAHSRHKQGPPVLTQLSGNWSMLALQGAGHRSDSGAWRAAGGGRGSERGWRRPGGGGGRAPRADHRLRARPSIAAPRQRRRTW